MGAQAVKVKEFILREPTPEELQALMAEWKEAWERCVRIAHALPETDRKALVDFLRLAARMAENAAYTDARWAEKIPDLVNALQSAEARGKAKARWTNDPKAAAMAEIRDEWERRRRPGAAFAREMHAKYSGVIASEASIKNAISRWRKEPSSC